MPQQVLSGPGYKTSGLFLSTYDPEQRRWKLNITLQRSPRVTGPFANTPASYDPTTHQLSAPATGSEAGFYRAKADRAGVRLGSPQVQGTNVLIGVQSP